MAIILDFDLDLRKPSLIEHLIDPQNNEVTTWESNPDEDFHIDSNLSFESKRNAGLIKEVDGEKLYTSTCKKIKYRIYKNRASFRTTEIKIIVKHYLEIKIHSGLFISQNATQSQRDAIINEFNNADASNPDVSAIMANLQNLNIPSTFYAVVPLYQVKRTKIEELDYEKRRLLSLMDPNVAGDIIGDSTLDNIDIAEWIRNNPLIIKEESRVHIPECTENDEDTLRVVNDSSEIDRAVDNISDIAQIECSLVEKTRKKIAVLAVYPQFKIRWRRKKIKVGCSRIVISLPQLMIREVREELYFILITNNGIEEVVLKVAKQCGLLAFGSAGIVGYITGNFKAALAAFKTAFNYCIESRLTTLYECILPELIIVRKSSKWRPV